ncbi:hypothetical protein BC830DRAFT_344721 [Chytriomyces sp. MP71]|nr:hypothetical protein BC830DRAFT_344721 [Chytriomyces sp. MP71]
MLLLLPLELQRNVLLWIPFGGPTLMRMQLVSRRIRDACDLAFARMHMRTLMASFASLHALWISPDPVTRKRVEWRCVPFVYRAAMYLELFTLPYDEDYDDYRLFPIPHHQATLLADLLIKNATLFTEATCHQRPLTGFSRYGHTDALLRILNHPSTVAKSHNNAALRWSAFHGHSGCVRALLNHGADPGVEEDFCLISACERGHADVLRALLEDGGANPAARENDGIRLASEGGHSACVRLLLKDPRVDPCVGESPSVAVLQ